MKATTVIIALASIGFMLMGLFILKSKVIAKSMIKEDNDINAKLFIKKNAYINIFLGIFGIILSVIDFILAQNNLIIVIVFISTIFISATVQSYLAKKNRN